MIQPSGNPWCVQCTIPQSTSFEPPLGHSHDEGAGGRILPWERSRKGISQVLEELSEERGRGKGALGEHEMNAKVWVKHSQGRGFAEVWGQHGC